MIKSNLVRNCRYLRSPLAFGRRGVSTRQNAKKPNNRCHHWATTSECWNISAYHRGMMGGSTPNIDRIAKEGALFPPITYLTPPAILHRRARPRLILGQTPIFAPVS